ncbi:NAD-dependent epimerase/dehydratase family protein [Rhodococcus spelaei]|uniref:NAD-dependent epimerase/dehydratase family protein n=1 Tax=Rhodococcus spelaei TaxID=2546320 RepID=A0A541BLQ7_9NOCA|nr:NAD(P)H-binding protein [Rhodococcus spelaei]TQF73270.1 NAD-dependent epimerase/dehydratase family protein [Rhodococcus spelaei]
MSTVLVVGGTGTAGAAVVAELHARGQRVRVLSRHAPAPAVAGIEHAPGDLLTGEGLAAALDGVEVLVSAVNGQTRKTRPVFTEGARNLTRAAEAAGVRRAVLLSIVGVDQVRFSYYDAIAEQERIYAASGLDTTIVRSTQFHTLLRSIFATTARIGVLPAVRGARFQPIAPADLARALADAALAESPGSRIEVGGPEVATMRELAETWKRVTGSRALVLGLPVPGPPGRFLRAGLNLTPENRCGTVTFEQWSIENRS